MGKIIMGGTASRIGATMCASSKCPNDEVVVDRNKDDRKFLVKEAICKGNSSPESGSADGWQSSSFLVNMSGSLSVSDVNISGASAVSLFVAAAIGSSMSDNPLSNQSDMCIGTW